MDKCINFRIRADTDPQPVAITLVDHVSDEDLAAFQLLEYRFHGPVGAPAPDKVGLAGRYLEPQFPQSVCQPAAGGADPVARSAEVVLVLQCRGRPDQAQCV